METTIENLDVKVTKIRIYGNVSVCAVKVGTKSIGYLYKEEKTWYVYGYRIKEDTYGRKGYLRDILGEDVDRLLMAKRLLMYKGYAPSNNEIGLEGSGVIR